MATHYDTLARNYVSLLTLVCTYGLSLFRLHLVSIIDK
jgi:hypothetical protein